MLILNLILILLSISLIYFQSKYSFLIDNPIKQDHKLDFNKNIPLSGGIFFLVTISTNLLISNHSYYNFLTIFFLFLFYLI